MATGFSRASPSLGYQRPAMPQASKLAIPAAAKMPEIGAVNRISLATPGVSIPDTSRYDEYTADISVRSDGLTALKNGSPAQISNRIRKKLPAKSNAIVAVGAAAAILADVNNIAQAANPV